ncbi:MAG: SCP2 sterol-binding domain-containing protein [Kistimonas sp.]|nr:SCP2 sterol-binding domain-containing protein [Kistimonas sp.]
MASLSEIFDGVKSRFSAQAAAGLDLVFQFDIEDGDTCHLVVKDSRCSLVEGARADANVTLIMNAQTLQAVVNGRLDAMQAFMQGKLRAEGDMLLAPKLSQLFPAAS